MVEILSAIRENLIMVSAFLVPLILMRAADIILGVAISRRNSVAWDWAVYCEHQYDRADCQGIQYRG